MQLRAYVHGFHWSNTHTIARTRLAWQKSRKVDSLPEPFVHGPEDAACVLNQWPTAGVTSCNSSHTIGSQGLQMRVALSLLCQIAHLKSATAHPQGFGLGGPDNSNILGKDASCREHSMVPLTWKLTSPSGLSCCNMRPADKESIPLLPGVPTTVIKVMLARRPRQPRSLWLEPRGFTGGPLGHLHSGIKDKRKLSTQCRQVHEGHGTEAMERW